MAGFVCDVELKKKENAIVCIQIYQTETLPNETRPSEWGQMKGQITKWLTSFSGNTGEAVTDNDIYCLLPQQQTAKYVELKIVYIQILNITTPNNLFLSLLLFSIIAKKSLKAP